MYDGDAMTQIFKRTKKCCAKLIRKLTFNTTTTANFPIKLRNSARYVQQKNKSCIQEKPTRPEDGDSGTTANDGSWDLARNERLMSSNNVLSDDVLSYDDEDYQMFHISPPFFLKRDITTSYSRVDSRCKRNCNFPPRLITSNLMTSMLLSRRDLGKFNKPNNNNSCCSDDEIVSNMKDSGDILLTDYKLQNNVSEVVGGSSSNNNNNSSIGRKAINRRGTTPCQNQYVDFDISNATRSGHNNEITTSFIVPQDLMEKFDSTLNLNNSFTEPSESWSGAASNKLAEIASNKPPSNNGAIKSSQHKRNDIESKIRTETVFEKVKYDKNKKYLRHTPTNSSVGSIASSPHSLYNGRFVTPEHSPSSFSLENSFSENLLYSSVSCAPSNENNLAWRRYNSSYDPNGNCYHLSVDSNPEEAINRINSIRRKYSGAWDSKGNSTDSRRILCDEAWDVFDNKINTARDKKMMILYPDGDFISPRSSSTTLETWVDDEIFDNSFNEELERSCASFER